jgi:hypothetical protein
MNIKLSKSDIRSVFCISLALSVITTLIFVDFNKPWRGFLFFFLYLSALTSIFIWEMSQIKKRQRNDWEGKVLKGIKSRIYKEYIGEYVEEKHYEKSFKVTYYVRLLWRPWSQLSEKSLNYIYEALEQMARRDIETNKKGRVLFLKKGEMTRGRRPHAGDGDYQEFTVEFYVETPAHRNMPNDYRYI